MSLPPWDQQTFSFQWEPWRGPILQCSTLDIQFFNDLGNPDQRPDPAPVPPYFIDVYQGGYAPLALAIDNINQRGTYHWNVNLPLGTTFIAAMRDSAGYSAGTSTPCTVVSGSPGCSVTPMLPTSLSLAMNGNSQCGNVNIVVNNGTSPYQVKIIPDQHNPRTLHFGTNEFSFILDLQAGSRYFVAVTDAEGHSYVEDIPAVGPSNDGSCLNAATTMTAGMFTSMFSGSGFVMPSTAIASATSSASSSRTSATSTSTASVSTSSKSSIGMIVGAAVGGAIVVAAILFIICWLLRRSRSQRREAAIQQEKEGARPEINQIHPGYNLPYGPQSSYIGAPQTQTHVQGNSGASGLYLPPGAAPAAQPYNFPHGPPTFTYNGVTTHAPQPQPLPQMVSYYSEPSTGQQSPASHNFSQGSGTVTPLIGGHRPMEGSSGDVSRGTDRKERAISPPPDNPANGSSYPWGFAASPPPRTGTALPPYELEIHPQGNRNV